MIDPHVIVDRLLFAGWKPARTMVKESRWRA